MILLGKLRNNRSVGFLSLPRFVFVKGGLQVQLCRQKYHFPDKIMLILVEIITKIQYNVEFVCNVSGTHCGLIVRNNSDSL